MRQPKSTSEMFTTRLVNVFATSQLSKSFERLKEIGVKTPTLLDVGCGQKPYRSIIESCGFKYKAMDVAPRVEDVDFIAALDDVDLCNRIKGGCFHVILLTEVLEHVDNHETAWRNLAYLLAPNGEIIITAPFIYPLHELPWDACRPTIYQIERFAIKNGMEIVVSSKAGSVSDVVGLLLANVNVCIDRGVLVRLFGLLFRAFLRLFSRFLYYVPILNCMCSDLYVSNLVVCRKH